MTQFIWIGIAGIYTMILFPIGMMALALMRTDLSKKARLAWLIVTFFVPIGSYLFAFIASGRKWVPGIAFLNLVFFALAFGNLTYETTGSKTLGIRQTAHIVTSLENVLSDAVSKVNQKSVINALSIMEEELKEPGFWLTRTEKNASMLIMMMDYYISSRTLTDRKADNWLGYYEKRNTMDSSILEDINRQLLGDAWSGSGRPNEFDEF